MEYLPSKKFGFSVAAIVAAALLVLGADAASHARSIAPGLAIAGQTTPTSVIADTSGGQVASSTASAWPNATPVSDIIATPSETKTAELSQDLAANYMAATQANGGNPLTQDQYMQVADQTVSADASNLVTTKTYTAANITVGKDDSDAALTAYANAMGKVLQTSVASVANTQDEEEVALQAMNNDDSSVLSQIDPRIAAYQAIVNGFLKISPPPSLATLHLALINDFSAFIAIDQGLELEFTDSSVALAALGQYENAFTQLNSDFTSVSAAYHARAISIPKSQAGYVFTNLQTASQ